MKKFMAEFKEFALKGNVIDMAVGVIIGAAFKAIVDSLVNDILTPFLGLFGGMDFSEYVFTVNGVVIKYGSFITAIINFVIMALIIFLFVKGINSLKDIRKKKEEEKVEEPTTKKCPFCKSEIDITATRCPHCTSEVE